MGQNQNPDRNHPEAKDRQKAKAAQHHQQPAQDNASSLGARQMDNAAENDDFPPSMETVIYEFVCHSDCWSFKIPEEPWPWRNEFVERGYDAFPENCQHANWQRAGKSSFHLFANVKGVL